MFLMPDASSANAAASVSPAWFNEAVDVCFALGKILRRRLIIPEGAAAVEPISLLYEKRSMSVAFDITEYTRKFSEPFMLFVLSQTVMPAFFMRRRSLSFSIALSAFAFGTSPSFMPSINKNLHFET